ncbi:hypothetical protein BO71DRAFT_482279 [Aspergillus ellipticus CBS 707.79]|uniref:Uncharacterized protein n=1 Tax=Aspergillus ellipticus CBS 707.79 TaxID=1448320 RepID=A0A319DFG0_9EURO|nr:hypothetical protein BO71DRAFT_482279 [Aspergillus ellipticus CBS 707.79]
MALRDQFRFHGSDADYIAFLEKKLLESSYVIATYQRAPQPEQNHHITDTINHQQGQSHEDEGDESGNLQIIKYKPEHTNFSKQYTTPRWQKELDQFLTEIPHLKSWHFERKKFLMGNDTVLRIAVYNHSATCHLSPESAGPPSSEGLIHTLLKYSTFTKNTFSQANTLGGLARFLELVFLSLCAVSMKIVRDPETVYNAMKNYISNANSLYLDKLICGAIWANSCISALLETPWGYRGQEIFLIAGQSVHFYSRYAQHKKSSDHFLENMKNKAPDSDVQSDMPAPILMIPLILEKLVGGKMPLSDICKLLRYCPDRVTACRPFFEKSLTATSQEDTSTYAAPSSPASVDRRSRDFTSQESETDNPVRGNTSLQPNKRRRLNSSISNLATHQTEAGSQLNNGLERQSFRDKSADLTPSHVHNTQEIRTFGTPTDDLLYGPQSCPSLQAPSL